MSKVKPAHNTCIAVACSIVFRMVHPCIVPGCTNRSNKEECKNIKFYTLPFNDERLLQIWLTLVCKRREEVTVHSRICSTHFANRIKKSNKDLPQIFPWQRYTLRMVPNYPHLRLFTTIILIAHLIINHHLVLDHRI